LDGAIQVLKQAKADIEAVLQSLREAGADHTI
jgi:hypothetical protein